MNSCAPQDWVLTWQIKLHEWAVADEERVFHDLFNLVYDSRSLQVAWEQVRSNRGSRTAGVDGVTRYHVETRIGVDPFVRELHQELRTGTYRPQPTRQKGIPKQGGKTRYLGIPTLRDRVVQQAVRQVLEPILEADFYASSYAYRPGRRAQDAIAEIYHFAKPHSGYSWVVEGDIRACFDNVDHQILMSRLRRRITDQKLLRLVRQFLRAGIITEFGQRQSSLTGTPQGGILSPLLANLYLSILDEEFERRWLDMSPYPSRRQWLRKKGLPTYRLIRYADDFVILVKGTREQAEGLKQETAEFLRQYLRMELSHEKTLVTHVTEGFDFLGHRIQQVQVDGKQVLRTFPSKASLQRVKEKVKRLTARPTIHLSLEQLLGTLNPVLRGWSNYFRFDAAKRTLAYLDYYTWWRVYHWLRKKHSRVSARKLKDRLLSDWVFREGGRELFRPSRVRVERYQFKGSKILHRWNQHLGVTDRLKHRELAFDDNAFLETISDLL